MFCERSAGLKASVLALAPPNCCKRLTKRRLFARAAVAALEQSALAGGAPLAFPFSIRSDRRAAVSVAVFSRFAIYANVVSPTPTVHYNVHMAEPLPEFRPRTIIIFTITTCVTLEVLFRSSPYLIGYLGAALYAAMAFAALAAIAAFLSLRAGRGAHVRGKILALLAGFGALTVGYAAIYYAIYLHDSTNFNMPASSSAQAREAFDDAYAAVQDVNRRLYLLSVVQTHESAASAVFDKRNAWITLDPSTAVRSSVFGADGVVAESFEVSDQGNDVIFTAQMPYTRPNLLGQQLIADPPNFHKNLLLLIGAYEQQRKESLAVLDTLTRKGRNYNFFDFLYFSVVTSTTLGYGDIVPGSRLARSTVMTQAIFSISYLAFGLTFLWPTREIAG